MEQSLSSLAFRGSIVEAIAEAKRQQKLFVVYIAGDNPESKQLETSTWNDAKVSETLSKYCILLHILEGSFEASNFSAIYPQHSAPCITVVGYNGVKLWQKEGFVSADVVISSLEKAWLSLHVQAAFLTAALASGKQPASGISETASPQQVTDDQILSKDAGQPLHAIDRNSYDDASKGQEADAKQDGVAFAELSSSNVLDNAKLDESDCKIEMGNISQDLVELGQNNPIPVPEKNSDLCDNNHPGSSNEASREIVDGAGDVAPVNTVETREVEKADTSDYSAYKSNDVFLNIRLPDGVSLQVKFSIMDTLKMVRDYIDENQTSSLGSFGIATPYPRRVFSNQDMDSTLSELGLLNRQALIVVPQNQNISHSRGLSSQSQTYPSDYASSNASGGYWASLKRLVSYVNPFSYLSNRTESTSSAQESQSGIWQYGPNPSLQNTRRNGGISSMHSPDQSTATSGRNSNSSSKNKHQTSRFGANIHTLKHDDDDNRFSDRNAFWNGNSTQFGGNDDGK